jgi:hypothetical protein
MMIRDRLPAAAPRPRPAVAPARPYRAFRAPPGAGHACACGGGCSKCAAGETRRRRAARDGGAEAPPPEVAPAAEPQVPQYRDCTPGITGIDDANERMETARLRAREYVGAARRTLANEPTAGSVYETALGRHFVAPTDAQRATVEDNYRRILGTLVVRNYICNSQNICGTEQAFWIPDDDLVHICRPFWPLSPTCRAIILIHEGAHDVGFGVGATHPPNRGSANYPAGNVAAPAGQTTALRMDNPDAYAFFASHVWRSTDTSLTCF